MEVVNQTSKKKMIQKVSTFPRPQASQDQGSTAGEAKEKALKNQPWAELVAQSLSEKVSRP